MSELSSFLKKYSGISSKFIDDFFSLYDYKTSYTDIIISFDKLAKWLNMRKDNLKKTLERTYVRDIDYNIKLIKSNKKGRPHEEIIITPECMKRLCMSSASEKGEQVRTYFIQLESLIDKYKQTIIDDLNKKVGILENNQKPKVDPKKGVIYVLRTSRSVENLFRIGRSKNFLTRLLSHNSIEPDNIEIVNLYEVDDIVRVENCVKNALKPKQYRKRKEIYQVDGDLIKEVINTCEKLICKVSKKEKKSKISKDENLFMVFQKKTKQNSKSEKKSKSESKKIKRVVKKVN